MRNTSTVAILMPVYNSEKYLKQAIESILNQTFREFVFYIYNDGSTDDSEKIILSCNDSRIKYINNEVNKGLIYTLNKGIETVEADYLIRMDADDISHPSRIETQINFMNAHPQVIVSGCQAKYFGASSAKTNYPLTNKAIKAHLLFSNVMIHPSVIIRLKRIKEKALNYNPDFLHSEDYEFWWKCSKHGELGNVDEVLLNYRLEGQNITTLNWHTRNERLKKVFGLFLSDLKIEQTETNLNLHLQLSNNTEKISSIKDLKNYTELLILQNKVQKIFDEQELKSVIQSNLKNLFYKIVDEKPMKVISYWINTHLFSLSQLRYLAGRMLKGNNSQKSNS